MNEYLSSMTDKCKEKMDIVCNRFKSYTHTIKAGIATQSLFDNMLLKYNNNNVKISHISNIQIVYPNIIYITPWDKNNIKIIEKTIMSSSLHLSPQSDKKRITITLPIPSKEQRLVLIKELYKSSETSKINLRNIRRHYSSLTKKYIEINKLSLDLIKKYSKIIQSITDTEILKVDKLIEDKKRDIIKI